jgi:hypothetical protein
MTRGFRDRIGVMGFKQESDEETRSATVGVRTELTVTGAEQDDEEETSNRSGRTH